MEFEDLRHLGLGGPPRGRHRTLTVEEAIELASRALPLSSEPNYPERARARGGGTGRR